MGLQTFYGKGPHRLLWTGTRAARGIVAISGKRNCLNYCEMFVVRTKFTIVDPGRVTHSSGPHAARGPWVGDPRSTSSALFA